MRKHTPGRMQGILRNAWQRWPKHDSTVTLPLLLRQGMTVALPSSEEIIPDILGSVPPFPRRPKQYLGPQQAMGHIKKFNTGSIVSDYGLDDRTIGVRSPAGAKDFFSSLCVHTGSGAHPASSPMGTGGPFPGGKARPGRDADHSPPSSAEVLNE
jgi:hypothetical protein